MDESEWERDEEEGNGPHRSNIGNATMATNSSFPGGGPRSAAASSVVSGGPSSSSLRGAELNRSFLEAVARGDLSTAQTLRKAGASRGSRDENGNNAVHLACLTGGLEMLRWLTRVRGVDLDAANADTDTPLHVAAFMGREDLCAELMIRGCAPYTENRDSVLPGQAFSPTVSDEARRAVRKLLNGSLHRFHRAVEREIAQLEEKAAELSNVVLDKDLQLRDKDVELEIVRNRIVKLEKRRAARRERIHAAAANSGGGGADVLSENSDSDARESRDGRRVDDGDGGGGGDDDRGGDDRGGGGSEGADGGGDHDDVDVLATAIHGSPNDRPEESGDERARRPSPVAANGAGAGKLRAAVAIDRTCGSGVAGGRAEDGRRSGDRANGTAVAESSRGTAVADAPAGRGASWERVAAVAVVATAEPHPVAESPDLPSTDRGDRGTPETAWAASDEPTMSGAEATLTEQLPVPAQVPVLASSNSKVSVDRGDSGKQRRLWGLLPGRKPKQ